MTSHTVFGGKVHVYKRDTGRFWQCATFLNSKNYRTTTKEESLTLAKEFAEDWYLTLKDKNRRSELVSGKTFTKAARHTGGRH